MTLTFHAAIYAARLFFLSGVSAASCNAQAPVQLRWEVFPVPHEEADRVAHRDSYFETGSCCNASFYP